MADPPSPLKAAAPVPAAMVMSPVRPSTRRIRWSPTVDTNTLPAASTATPVGVCNPAAVAGPPSPPEPTVPVPATGEMIAAGVTLYTLAAAESATRRSPDPSKAKPAAVSNGPAKLVMMPEVLTLRMVFPSAMYRLPAPSTARPWRGVESWAAVASPPLPEVPSDPSPATVVISPLGSTRRTTKCSMSLT